MSGEIGIGLAQIGVEPLMAEESRERSVHAATQAFAEGADIVVLPEMVVPGYSVDWRALAQLAEPLKGPTVAAWTEVAADAGGYVVGGFCERDGEALYNSAAVVGPDGPILHYRKLHLFDQEKIAFRPGNLGLPLAHTRFGTVGVCICYDLRFVEVVRILALRGADLVCVPTAWLPGFDDQRWDAEGMCPQAHGAVLQANLNQVFIAAASQAGRHGGLDFLGSSVLADPLGARVTGPLPGGEDQVVVTRVDAGAAKAARVRSPLITPRADRRRDVYALSIDGEAL